MNPRATISLSGISRNYLTLKQQHPKQQLYAVVKTGAYNHGVEPVVQQLSMADGFCVATLEEGIELRSLTPNQRICVMHGAYTVGDWQIIDELNLDSCLHSIQQFESLKQHSFQHLPTLWVKINTGMNRLGLTIRQAQQILPMLSAYDCILFSHYACSEQQNHPSNAQQNQKIQCIHQAFPHLKQSVANSATLVNPALDHGDIIRSGIALYGHSELHPSLAPTLTFDAPIVAIQPIKAGEAVGYGQRWVSPKDGYLAVIRAGYADGYPRSLPDGTPIAINGNIYPLAGCISMDLCTAFLDNNPHQIKIGDWAELWGKQVLLTQIARHAQTIPYELLCNLGDRVERQYQ